MGSSPISGIMRPKHRNDYNHGKNDYVGGNPRYKRCKMPKIDLDHERWQYEYTLYIKDYLKRYDGQVLAAIRLIDFTTPEAKAFKHAWETAIEQMKLELQTVFSNFRSET